MRHHKRSYRNAPGLSSKFCAGSSRAGEEITEGTGERDDLNNPADKLPEENDERPENRAEEHEERRH